MHTRTRHLPVPSLVLAAVYAAAVLAGVAHGSAVPVVAATALLAYLAVRVLSRRAVVAHGSAWGSP